MTIRMSFLLTDAVLNAHLKKDFIVQKRILLFVKQNVKMEFKLEKNNVMMEITMMMMAAQWNARKNLDSTATILLNPQNAQLFVEMERKLVKRNVTIIMHKAMMDVVLNAPLKRTGHVMETFLQFVNEILSLVNGKALFL